MLARPRKSGYIQNVHYVKGKMNRLSKNVGTNNCSISHTKFRHYIIYNYGIAPLLRTL